MDLKSVRIRAALPNAAGAAKYTRFLYFASVNKPQIHGFAVDAREFWRNRL